MFRVASTPPNSTWLSIVRLRSGQRSHLATFPWKVDPGVLAYFGDVSVDQRAAQRLGIDHGEMRFRHQLAQYLGGADRYRRDRPPPASLRRPRRGPAP